MVGTCPTELLYRPDSLLRCDSLTTFDPWRERCSISHSLLAWTTGLSTGETVAGVAARAANTHGNDCNPDGRRRGTPLCCKEGRGRSAVPVVQNLLDFRKHFDEDFKSIGDLIKAAKIE